MNIPNKLTIAIVCSALLTWLPAAGGNEIESEMVRHPEPGEKIEKTKLSDAEIEKLLVGEWLHEYKLFSTTKIFQKFAKDGSYTLRITTSDPKKKGSAGEGKWTLTDGILTLTPTAPEGKKERRSGRFDAYTILKISDAVLEWQIDYERSDTPSYIKRSLLIYTHKRVK